MWPWLPLLAALAGAWIVLHPEPLLAQGLREDALQLIDEAGAATALESSCIDLLPRAQALLTQITTAEAAAFMPAEVARLNELVALWVTLCPDQDGTPDDAELRMLLWRCEDLGQARAFCELRAQCASVSHMSQRMADFWRAAATFPCN